MHPVDFDPELVTNAYKTSPDLPSNFSSHQDFSENIKKDDILQNPNLDSIALIEEVADFSDACLKFISDILLEEEFEENPNLEFSALQATEKSLYDALGEEYSPLYDHLEHNSLIPDSGFDLGYVDGDDPCFEPLSESTLPKEGQKVVNQSSSKKNHKRDEGGEGGRSSKQQASTFEDYVEMKEFDDVLLGFDQKKSLSKDLKGKKTRGKKPSEDVDLSALLSNCAQAVSNYDLRTAHELLRQIRQHSTPYGDSLQRLSHYFANALEARLAGTGSTFYGSIVNARISSSGLLRAFKLYMTSIPFERMLYFLADNMICKLSENAATIHVIDFGILLGIQWPCLIQLLSKRPTGPPRLRITGIDYPQHGFRPSERVDATGRRLAGYCERFNVPFEYNGIVAKSWESIKLEDFKIDKDELVFINCMFRSGTLQDETVVAESPRDGFLRLIRDINPRLFLHGTVNGSLNAPFFIMRFKEALLYYSLIFDLFEATMTREDHERLVVESEIYGKEAMNVIACEGIERIQRPENYKQWQVRSIRAGLRQVPLDRELVNRAKAMVKGHFHKDFVVDEDRHWMLQGWKGRLFSALSLWQPNSP